MGSYWFNKEWQGISATYYQLTTGERRSCGDFFGAAVGRPQALRADRAAEKYLGRSLVLPIRVYISQNANLDV